MTSGRLTPNQRLTPLFPTVGEREPSPDIHQLWKLEVVGLIKRPVAMSFPDLMRMPHVKRTWDTVCVTGWTHLDHCWTGVLIDEILKNAEPLPQARFVRFEAYSIRNHDTSLPLEYARHNILLAFELDGAPLALEHGAPVRTVCKGKYFYKSLKWIKKIELLERDQLGYWERVSAYHNEADPVREQRLWVSPMKEEEFRVRLQRLDFSGAHATRDEKFTRLRDDLINLADVSFEQASIKGCDLRKIQMPRARCRDANFSLTKFTNADLRWSDFSGCDLEGVDFIGADLTGADLRNTALTMTRFTHIHNPATVRGTRFLRVNLEVPGFDEAERRFLLDKSRGARIE